MTTTKGTDSKGRRTWLWKWKLWGDVTLAVARRVDLRCKPDSGADPEQQRRKRNNRAHSHKAKDSLYRRQKGRCAVCGKPFRQSQMQCHHLLPQNRYPELGSVRDNMALVCPTCHLEIHNNPFLNSRLMVAAACRMKIDLTERYEG